MIIFGLIWIISGIIGVTLLLILEYQESKQMDFSLFDIFIILSCILLGGILLLVYALFEYNEFYDIFDKIFNTPLISIKGKKK